MDIRALLDGLRSQYPSPAAGTGKWSQTERYWALLCWGDDSFILANDRGD